MIRSLTLAAMEIRMGLRNRWVLATTLLMATLSFALAALGSAPTGVIDVDLLLITVVSLSSLSVFFVPLIALLLSHDSIAGEVEQGTMLLLVSYPISRSEVVIGKFIGQFLIITLAIIVGLSLAAVVVLFKTDGGIIFESWLALLNLGGATIALGACFVALGLWASSMVKQRAAAAGIAISLWLFFAVLFDLGLLSILVSDVGSFISAEVFNGLLLLNPTDIFRIINETGAGGTSLVSGMAGLSAKTGLSHTVLWAALGLWIVIPLVLAVRNFKRKDL
ncbi:MAG: ABC transporter permease [Sphingomonadales bacterium]|nr:ABC transporter permease [Sphingomonadales bacterium]